MGKNPDGDALFFHSRMKKDSHTLKHPSAPPLTRRSRMEAANARAALHVRVAAQRILQACSTLFLKIGGSERAFARAKMRRNVCVSSDHLPPTSPAKTTRRARERRPTNSGCVRSFLRRAWAKMMPSMFAVPGLAVPTPRMGDTRVVSIASCAPPYRGNPSTRTSNRRASWAFGRARSISLTMTFTATLPPASRQTRAAALSTANPRLPNSPALEHAARWWPQGSSERPHRQKRNERGSGRRRRRRRSTRKRDGSILVKKLIGATDQRDTGERTTLRAHQCFLVIGPCGHHPCGLCGVSPTLEAASCCHPCLNPPGSVSSGSRDGGRRPSASASQDGTSKPSTPINWKAARAAERMQGPAGRALFKEP